MWRLTGAARGPGPRRKRGGQTAIELTIAVIASFVLIVASFRVWVWLMTTIVEREEAYQQTRRRAGRHLEPGKLDYYTPQRLRIFDE
jgi:hypothetical protein